MPLAWQRWRNKLVLPTSIVTSSLRAQRSKPSVYCDGIELARIENGRYFQIEIPSGEHTFYANDKQAGAVVKVEAGKDYYFRVDLQTGFWKGHYRLNVVAPEQGEYDLRKLKPLDSNKVVHASVPDTAAAN